jgi:hypothetical protein
MAVLFHNLQYIIQNRLIIALACVDAALIIANIGVSVGQIRLPGDPDLWKLSTDRGIGEWFEYAKLFVGSIFAAILFTRTCSIFFGVLSVALIALAVDNAFMIHEWFGRTAAQTFEAAPAFLGSLAPSLVIAAAIGASAVGGYFRGDAEERLNIAVTLVAIAVLGAFGVGLDTLEGVAKEAGRLEAARALNFIENAGEMVALSLLVAALAMVSRRRPTDDARAG